MALNCDDGLKPLFLRCLPLLSCCQPSSSHALQLEHMTIDHPAMGSQRPKKLPYLTSSHYRLDLCSSFVSLVRRGHLQDTLLDMRTRDSSSKLQPKLPLELFWHSVNAFPGCHRAGLPSCKHDPHHGLHSDDAALESFALLLSKPISFRAHFHWVCRSRSNGQQRELFLHHIDHPNSGVERMVSRVPRIIKTALLRFSVEVKLVARLVKQLHPISQVFAYSLL
mmetsp:Transcript_15574/g.27664  ORF Transcript_15574/g.27664 Transcript_15574/m.27664 type:complete len:223 (-) Transcript_15574:580-1248(-)